MKLKLWLEKNYRLKCTCYKTKSENKQKIKYKENRSTNKVDKKLTKQKRNIQWTR